MRRRGQPNREIKQDKRRKKLIYLYCAFPHLQPRPRRPEARPMPRSPSFCCKKRITLLINPRPNAYLLNMKKNKKSIMYLFITTQQIQYPTISKKEHSRGRSVLTCVKEELWRQQNPPALLYSVSVTSDSSSFPFLRKCAISNWV